MTLRGRADPRSRRDRPAKPALSREAIVDAGLEIVREEGHRRAEHAPGRAGARHRPGLAVRLRRQPRRAAGSCCSTPRSATIDDRGDRPRALARAAARARRAHRQDDGRGLPRASRAWGWPRSRSATTRCGSPSRCVAPAGGRHRPTRRRPTRPTSSSRYITAIAYEQSLYAELYNDPEHEQREVERIAERFATLSPERFPTMAALGGADDARRRRGALLARPRHDRQRPARDADRGSAQPRRLGGEAVSSGSGSSCNIGNAGWESKGEFGVRTRFESPDDRFAHFGINVQVLAAGATQRPLPRRGGPGGIPRARWRVPGGDRRAESAPSATVGLLPLPTRHPPRPRRCRLCPCTVLMVGTRAARRCPRSSIPRTRSPRATARRSAPRHARRSRPTRTARTRGRPRHGAVARRLTRAV